MPKYWGKQIFTPRRFPGVGHKQKTEKKERRKKKEERAKVGDNNGQTTHGACKHAWRMQAAWSILYAVTTVELLSQLKTVLIESEEYLTPWC